MVHLAHGCFSPCSLLFLSILMVVSLHAHALTEYRSVGETQMNDRSSRSHTIFTLTVESRLRGEEVEDKAVKVAALVRGGIYICVHVF